MQRRGTFLPIFFIFLVLSIIIFFLAQKGYLSGVSGFFEQVTVPIQRFTFGIFHPGNLTTEAKLQEENMRLHTQIAKQKGLERENQALHDQFESINPTPKKLLPATIMGMHDDELIIDKGQTDGVKTGSVIVYKDNLVGKVVQVAKHLSVIHLVTHTDTSFTAQTSKTASLGVIKGRGEAIVVLDNVVLSDKLEKDDIVVTKGDIDNRGQGYPPDLVVGKIVSVNKRASNLFQQAEVRSLVDVSKLKIVFVLSEF